MGPLVGHVLDANSGRIQKLPGQVRQGAGGGDLLPDQGDLLVGGITLGLAAADQLILARRGQASLRACLAVDLSDVQAC
jgi:hypothetical protein